MKKIILAYLIFTVVLCSAYRKPYKYVINAEKDAFFHNSLGVNYLQDRIYYAAIQEFKMAISLNPKTQATAVYFNNLGKVYMTIGYPQLALDCFQNARTQYNLNLEFYENLVLHLLM